MRVAVVNRSIDEDIIQPELQASPSQKHVLSGFFSISALTNPPVSAETPAFAVQIPISFACASVGFPSAQLPITSSWHLATIAVAPGQQPLVTTPFVVSLKQCLAVASPHGVAGCNFSASPQFAQSWHVKPEPSGIMPRVIRRTMKKASWRVRPWRSK